MRRILTNLATVAGLTVLGVVVALLLFPDYMAPAIAGAMAGYIMST